MKRLLIVLILFSLFSNAFAIQKIENTSIDIISTMAKVEPYMKLNQDKTVRFDFISAKLILDARTLEIGKKYERFHNSTMNAIRSNQKPFQTTQDKEDLKVFEPFFIAIQQSGSTTTKELINSRQITTTTATAAQGTLYSKKPTVINFSAKTKIPIISFACNGGGPTAPAYCPSWNYPSTLYSSQTAVKSALAQMGFHNTYAPGCGWEYSCSSDYTKWISANGCNLGVFRTQAIPYSVNTTSGIKWKYRYQTPEPNPEILSYTWPAAIWWGPYVLWWHQVWPQPNGHAGC